MPNSSGTSIAEAIPNFIEASVEPDQPYSHPNPAFLDHVYHPDVETQVLVDKTKGEPHATIPECRVDFTPEGIIEFKPIRIPYGSNTDSPSFPDRPLEFRLDKYATYIGISGWDWRKQVSRSTGIDVDSLITHTGKALSPEQLNKLVSTLSELDYLLVVQSTSGTGIHIHVIYDEANLPVTKTHDQHEVLSQMAVERISADAGIPLEQSVDCHGRILWIWSNSMQPNSFRILEKPKRFLSADDFPDLADRIEAAGKDKPASQTVVSGCADEYCGETPLDDEHLRIIECSGMQVAHDGSCFHVHTHNLLQATTKHVGYYNTVSKGNHPNEPNAFAYPLPDGRFRIVRFNDAAEHECWDQGPGEHTKIIYNQADLTSVYAEWCNGFKQDDGSYAFEDSLKLSGAFGTPFPDKTVTLKLNPEGDLVASCPALPGESFDGWRYSRKVLRRIIQPPVKERPLGSGGLMEGEKPPFFTVENSNGDLIEYVLIFPDGSNAVAATRDEVKNHLVDLGITDQTTHRSMLGRSRRDSLTLVSKPFHPVFPSETEFNPGAPQLAFEPCEGKHPHCDSIISHQFEELASSILDDPYCQEYNIRTPLDFGYCYYASAIQRWEDSPPILLLHGPQESGKSAVSWMVSCLLKGSKGVSSITRALTSDFNGPCENALFGFSEEVSLLGKTVSQGALKDMVTNPTIEINKKGRSKYSVSCYVRPILMVNDPDFIGIEYGDTRHLVLKTLVVYPRLPQPELRALLREEAPALTHTLLNYVLPPTGDRMFPPVLDTPSKLALMERQHGKSDPVRPLDFSELAKRLVVLFKGSKLSGPMSVTAVLNKIGIGPWAAYARSLQAQLKSDKLLSELKKLGYSITVVENSNGRVYTYEIMEAVS